MTSFLIVPIGYAVLAKEPTPEFMKGMLDTLSLFELSKSTEAPKTLSDTAEVFRSQQGKTANHVEAINETRKIFSKASADFQT